MKKSLKVTSIIFLLVVANVFTACSSKSSQALSLNISSVNKNISQDSNQSNSSTENIDKSENVIARNNYIYNIFHKNYEFLKKAFYHLDIENNISQQQSDKSEDNTTDDFTDSKEQVSESGSMEDVVYNKENEQANIDTNEKTNNDSSIPNENIEQESDKIEKVYKPRVALTFDDGPSKEVTNTILDVLKENNAKATFFQIGKNVEKYPDISKRIIQEGSEIGNHSYDHSNLTSLTAEQMKYQIDITNSIILQNTNYEVKLVRPTYGAINELVKGTIENPLILWSIDTLDWKYRDKNYVVKSILDDVKDGDIILMHDLYQSTADACKVVIPELIARGYDLVTVTELFESSGITLESSNKYRYAPPLEEIHVNKEK